MEQLLSLHLKNFNKRVQVMNQTNSKEMILSAIEARNLQSEIFELLTKINDLTELKKISQEQENIVIAIGDGGNF
jgi:hypothetical protein